MGSIGEFLKPENKEKQKRNLRLIYLFGAFFVFLIGFLGGMFLSGSVSRALLVGIIVSFPFIITAIPLYIISIIGINKKWGRGTWSIVYFLMILVALLILLLR